MIKVWGTCSTVRRPIKFFLSRRYGQQFGFGMDTRQDRPPDASAGFVTLLGMGLILLLIVLIIVFGGGGYYMGPGIGYYGGGGVDLVLALIVIYLVFGRGRRI